MTPNAEFDKYSSYDGGMCDPLKKLLGGASEAYQEVKISWLTRFICQTPDLSGPISILDFGCGAGHLLSALAARLPDARLAGCDVSEVMIAQARELCPARVTLECRQVLDAFYESSFDLIVASSVFHHIAPNDWYAVLKRLVGALRPHGRLCVVEHNPINPITQAMTRRCPIDRDAVLLFPHRLRRLFTSVDLCPVGIEYLMFFPPRFTFLRPLERALCWLPLGGQYVAYGQKL